VIKSENFKNEESISKDIDQMQPWRPQSNTVFQVTFPLAAIFSCRTKAKDEERSLR
jgi:hypothetical protein